MKPRNTEKEMTKEEIFIKAMQKAVENGYTGSGCGLGNSRGFRGTGEDALEWLIMSHEWAEAFFGEKYEAHLMELVLTEPFERIYYLEKLI